MFVMFGVDASRVRLAAVAQGGPGVGHHTRAQPTHQRGGRPTHHSGVHFARLNLVRGRLVERQLLYRDAVLFLVQLLRRSHGRALLLGLSIVTRAPHGAPHPGCSDDAVLFIPYKLFRRDVTRGWCLFHGYGDGVFKVGGVDDLCHLALPHVIHSERVGRVGARAVVVSDAVRIWFLSPPRVFLDHGVAGAGPLV